MRVGELARRSGCSATTLRYYEKLGLLPLVSRTTSGYREYPADALDQLALIRRAKELGFSLREIRALLARPRGTSREAVLAAVASKLTDLERQKKSVGSKERQLRDLRGRVLRDGRAKSEDVAKWLLQRGAEDDGMAPTRGSLGHFDERGYRVINLAAGEAKRYDHGYIGTEHLLLALARIDDGEVRTALSASGLSIAAIRKGFEDLLTGPLAAASRSDDGIFINPRVNRIMGIAEGIAFHDRRRATAEDLMLAMLEEGGGLAIGIIRKRGGDPERIAATLRGG
jgi:DNA-binding transcriptional MerR regulator